MWIFSKTGFVSIVKHRSMAGHVMVRARVYEDLRNFLDVAEEVLHYAEDRSKTGIFDIHELGGSDYRFRVVMLQRDAATVVGHMLESIDYDNFKNATHGEQDRDRAYMEVWSAMNRLQDWRQYNEGRKANRK
jgi:hypothetical protein